MKLFGGQIFFALLAFRSPASLETTGPMLADKHGLSTCIAPGGSNGGLWTASSHRF